MIKDAERSGELRPGQTVVELTSGNTGTGLAIVCGVKGYPFVAVVSRGNSAERAQMMRALGAEIVLVDQVEGASDGHVSGDDLARVETAAQQLALERDAYRADQFRLAGNVAAHQFGTGPEIWEQSGGTVEVFCETSSAPAAPSPVSPRTSRRRTRRSPVTSWSPTTRAIASRAAATRCRRCPCLTMRLSTAR